MENNYITVTQLSKYLKYKFDNDVNLGKVYLKGEISNFKAHTRGHYYFTLKDEESRINAVMFSSSTSNLKFMPVDGMKVLVTGKITVYVATGGYQIYVSDMIEDGVGNLYIAYEQLKKKLESEGLFREEHKKKIPRMPKKIGIVTASTGAAIRDILTTLKRRYPIVETILFPSLVQGADAAKDIAHKIEIANTYDIDTLIVGRGGGSIEDLWPFNEEIVARAIYNSKVPIISAVGHEVDFTIADFAVVDINTVIEYLEKANLRSYNGIKKLINDKQIKLNNLSDSYVLKKPSNIYEVKEQKLDMLIDKININMKRILDNTKIRLYTSINSYILTNPSMIYLGRQELLKNYIIRINNNINKYITQYKTLLFRLENSYVLTSPDVLYKYKQQKLDSIISKLDVLNPMNTLKRGYTITRSSGKVINSIINVEKNSNLEIEMTDGKIDVKVVKVGDK